MFGCLTKLSWEQSEKEKVYQIRSLKFTKSGMSFFSFWDMKRYVISCTYYVKRLILWSYNLDCLLLVYLEDWYLTYIILIL